MHRSRPVAAVAAAVTGREHGPSWSAGRGTRRGSRSDHDGRLGASQLPRSARSGSEAGPRLVEREHLDPLPAGADRADGGEGPGQQQRGVAVLGVHDLAARFGRGGLVAQAVTARPGGGDVHVGGGADVGANDQEPHEGLRMNRDGWSTVWKFHVTLSVMLRPRGRLSK